MARLCPHLGLLALALFVWLTVSVASVRPSIAAEANFEEYFPGMDPESEVKRTTHSRHFQNSDGSTTAVLSVSPIHYEDSNGDLKLYDFTPRYSSRSGFTYQVTGSEVHGYYPSSATGWYRIERHDGYYIAWRETGMFYISPSGSMQLLENPSAGMPVVSGTQLTYPSVYAGVTNYLTASPATIKHDYYFASRPSFLNSYSDGFIAFECQLELDSRLRLLVEGQQVLATAITDGSIVFADANGVEIMCIPAPYAAEVGIVRDGGTSPVSIEVIRDGANFRLIYRTPVSWLASQSRVFPVLVDPTLQLTASQISSNRDEQGYTFNCFFNHTSGAWGQIQYSATGGALSLGAFVGCFYNGSNPSRSMLMWRTDSVNDYAEVTKVEARLYQSSNWSYTGSGQTTDVYHMATNFFEFPYDIDPTDTTGSALPVTSTYPSLYDDMGAGNAYATNAFTSFATNSWFPGSASWWDLGTDAASDCESQLLSKYFGFSIATRTSTRTSQGLATFAAYNDSVTANRNLLRITYIDSQQMVLDSNYSGASVAVDGIVYDVFPATISVGYGNRNFAAADEVVITGNQERYKFRNWSNGVTDASTIILIDKNFDFAAGITAFYDHEYFLEIDSVEGNIAGDPEGWYPVGTLISTSISGATGETIDTRRLARGWTGEGSAPIDGTGTDVPVFALTMYSKIIWIWDIQYKLSMQGALTAFVGPEPGWYFRNQAMSGVGVFPWVQQEDGIRKYAAGWLGLGAIGDGLGNIIPDWTISKPTIITWQYEIRYELDITSAHDVITGDPADYYSPGSQINTGVTRIVNDAVTPGIRYEARSWTAMGSLLNGNGNLIPTFVINEPTYIVWVWTTQYQLTMTSLFGAVSPVSGSWFDAGQTVAVVATVPPDDNQQQYTWNQWTGTGDGSITGGNPTDSIVMNAPIRMTAVWNARFYLSIDPGIGGFEADVAGWYDYDQSVVIQATPPAPRLDTRFILGWTGTGPGAKEEEPSLATLPVIAVKILGPTQQNAVWVTQYRVRVRNTATYGDPRPAVGDYWVTEGELFYGSVMPNVSGMLCAGYTGTGSLSNSTAPIFSALIMLPTSITWLWKEGVDIPMPSWTTGELAAFGFRGRNLAADITPDGSVYAVAFYSHESRELRCNILFEGVWKSFVIAKGESIGTFMDMRLDANGNPHIAFFDGVRQEIVYSAFVQDSVNTKPGEGAFQTEVVEAGNYGRSLSMAVSSIGEPHMVYYDETFNDFRYLRRTPDGWLLVPIFSPDDIAYHCSIALTPLVDIPQVVFLNRTTNSLIYGQLINSQWDLSTIYTGAGIAGPISLRLDIGGRPFVGFKQFVYPNTWRYVIANEDESGWSSATVVEETGEGIDASFVLDSIGYIHLAYNQGETLNYLRNNGLLWERLILDLGPVNEWDLELQIDQNENLVLGFWNGNDLKVVHTTGMDMPMGNFIDLPPAAPIVDDGLVQSAGTGAGCFIATAAFGAASCNSVASLCGLRDSVLASSATPSSLVSLYYSVSPAVARDAAGLPALRSVIRQLLRD